MAEGRLRVIVHIAVKPERISDFIREFTQKLIAPTLGEPGCIEYDLVQDDADPSRFALIETWENEEALRVHLAQEALQAAIATITPMAAEPLRIQRVHSVPVGARDAAGRA
jgi:quinol monooxygenase YgiN